MLLVADREVRVLNAEGEHLPLTLSANRLSFAT
jgi:hypothetical protein